MNDIYLKKDDCVAGEVLLYVGGTRALYTFGKSYEIINVHKPMRTAPVVYILDDEDSVRDPWAWDSKDLLVEDIFIPMSRLSEKDLFAFKIGGIEALGITYDSKD